MIKITTLFFLIILGVNVLIAQTKDFPTSEATWIFNKSDPFPSEVNKTYYISSDSIINGITYQSLNNGSDFFRTEGKKVYHLPNTLSQEYLSYDFSLVEGDSLIVYVSGYNSSSTTIFVEKVDSILTNDGFRKIWFFSDTNGDLDGQWIEGIGSYGSLFPPFYQGFVNEQLLCFTNEDDWIIQDTIWLPTTPSSEISCDGVIVSTKEPSFLGEKVKISPNPYINQFEILTPDIPKNTNVEIYSLYGQLIQTITYQGQISTPELPSGIYLLSFKLEQIQYNSLLEKL